MKREGRKARRQLGTKGWVLCCCTLLAMSAGAAERKTVLSIEGREFRINGQPTYKGREFRGKKIEGLLMNSRMVQGAFDDLNPQTRHLWKYPDGSEFDAERNTREFIQNMAVWRKHGLLSFTINFQGGSPQGYSREQPWHNSAFTDEGELRPAYLARMERILDRADELGMVPMVGYFYFGQAPRFKDEKAVVRATENATDWLISKGYTNVMIEIANECNHGGYPEIVKPKRADALIKLVKERSAGRVKNPAGRFYVSTSLTGGQIPNEVIVGASDYLLLHGNGVGQPERIREMVNKTRAVKGYRNQPILFNEDDHFDFAKPDNNMVAAVSQYASWGYFDYRMKGEGFDDGYQSVPVNWGISSERKRGFFGLLQEMTGGE